MIACSFDPRFLMLTIPPHLPRLSSQQPILTRRSNRYRTTLRQFHEGFRGRGVSWKFRGEWPRKRTHKSGCRVPT